MKRILFAAGAAVCAVSIFPAHAQSTSPGVQSERSATTQTFGDTKLEEIVVTAERREARLQDVPITMTAATAAQLQASGVTEAFDIGKITPSFNTNRVVGFGSPIMRGIGTTNVTAGDEPSVATYIDGFYQGNAITAGIPFNNLERIEVLKGPQGTLYGRNATGGLVNIVTRDPGDELSVSGNVGYANYQTATADAYLTGPIADGIAAGLSATYRHQDEGFYDNLVDDATLGRNEFYAVKGKLRFAFGDNSLVLGADYIASKDDRANTNIPFPGSLPLTTGTGIVYSQRPFKWAGSIKPMFEIEQWNVNAKLTLDLDFANFVSLTQYKELTNRNQVEGDGTTANGVLLGTQLGIPASTALTPLPVIPYTFAYTVRQEQPYFVTQELQLVSKDDGPIKWIVGGFFLASKDEYVPLNVYFDVSDLAVPFTSIRSGIQTTASAAFAQGTYSFANGLSVTTGVRYSHEEKEVSGSTAVPLFGLLTSDRQEKSFDSFTYRLAIDYRLNPELLLYATMNKGFKSGTFVGNNPSAPAVKPEILYAYEGGIKWDPTEYIRVNGSAYYYDYRDIQTFITAADLTSLLQNAAKAKLYGAELSMEAAPMSGLNISFGVGYEHAEFREFQNASVYVPSPSGGNYLGSVDAIGNDLIRTPDLTANSTIIYRFGIGPGTVALSAAVSYTNPFYWDADSQFRQSRYALLDLSARYTSPDDRWSVTLWGKNVTDREYAIYRNPQQRYDAVSYGDPATYGLSFGFNL